MDGWPVNTQNTHLKTKINSNIEIKVSELISYYKSQSRTNEDTTLMTDDLSVTEVLESEVMEIISAKE